MRRLLATLVTIVLCSLFTSSIGQATEINKPEPRPYKISNTGKQFTVRSNRTIETIMLWTTDGHRVVEQRSINNNTFSFSIPLNNRLFFLMVGLEGGKVYTEKIGVVK